MQLGMCPEAATHLQEMKDMLILISNELLDNVNELNPEQIEKLRQDRYASCLISHPHLPFCLRSNGSSQRERQSDILDKQRTE